MITKNAPIFLIIVLFFFGVIFIYFNSFNRRYSDKVYPNIFLDNILISGKTKDELTGQSKKIEDRLKKISIGIIYNNMPIATYSASRLNIHTDRNKKIDRAYSIGRSADIKTRLYEKFACLLGLQKIDIQTSIFFDLSPIVELLSLSEEKYNKPARNALFKFENNRVISFRQEEYGLKILSDDLINNLEKRILAIKSNPDDISIVLKNQIVKPEILLSEANNFGIEEKIGEGRSDFSHSSLERIHNLTLAASKFNGVLIPKNKELSFNETVGDISASTGYKQAYIIKGGRTVLGDGGGVCQVSTTLFRSALNSGLSITERFSHDYRVSYYENDSKPGLDATVFDPSADLKIKNNTPGAILIETEIDGSNNLLFFHLYGKKDGRKIEISPVTVYDQLPPLPAKYQDDPTLKKGVTKQVDFSAWGAKAKFNYKVTKNGEIIFEKTFFSNYRPWAAVYLVGTSD